MLGPYDLTFHPYLSSGSIWTGPPIERPGSSTPPSPDTPRIWFWMPRALLTIEGTLDHINQLVAAGWERIPDSLMGEWDNGLVRIFGQLGDIRAVKTPNTAEQVIWAPAADIARIEKVSVALAFTLDELPAGTPPAFTVQGSTVQLYQLAEVLPPPQFGMKAMIFTSQSQPGQSSNYVVYDLQALPPTAQALQAQIADKLRELVAPSDWRVILPSMEQALQAAAAMEQYTQMRHDAVSHLLSSSGATRERWRAVVKDLEDARDYYDRMRLARHKLNAEQWIDQWGELRTMAQQLAAEYHAAYEREEAAKRQALALVPVTPPSATTAPARSMPPTVTIFSADELAQIPSTWPVLTVLDSFSAGRAKGWRADETTGAPTFRKTTGEHDTAIQVRPPQPNAVLDDTTLDSLWKQVRAYTDLDGDVFLAMLAQAMSVPPDEDGYVWINAGVILDYRGITPIMKQEGNSTRRAGHRSEDMIEIADCVGRQASQWVLINSLVIDEGSTTKRSKKTKRRYRHESALTLIAETIRQDELLAPNAVSDEESRRRLSYPVAWRYRMGTWLTPFLKGPNRHMALLTQQALRYDPYRETWEKRIARYLIFHLRVNAHGGSGQISRNIGKLLNDLSLHIEERNPERTRTRFEKALNRLQKDRQLDHWEYAPDNPSLPARGWLETWKSWNVLFEVAPLAHEASERIQPDSADG